MENRVLKVVRGAFVAMKGTQNKSIFSKTEVPLQVKTSDSNCLWHMHLGHAGENASQGLVKQGLLKGAKTGKFDFCEHCVLGKQQEPNLVLLFIARKELWNTSTLMSRDLPEMLHWEVNDGL